MDAVQIAAGAAAGAGAAPLYFAMLKAQARAMERGGAAGAAAGLWFLARMAVLGGGMAALLAWAYPAGAAFAAAFLAIRFAMLRRLRSRAAGDEAEPDA